MAARGTAPFWGAGRPTFEHPGRAGLTVVIRAAIAAIVASVAGILLIGPGMLVGIPFEERLIYFPARQLVATPRDVGLAFEDVRFGPDDRLHGWFVPGRGPQTLIWFHGNAGNISHRVDGIRLLHQALGVSVLIFDYQGYGRSAGRPTESGTYADARAALAYLRSRSDVDPSRVVYLGKSLGAAVAVELAADEPPDRLIVQSAFTSIGDMARLHYRWLPVSGLIRTRYPTIERIGRVDTPILIVHGERDELVPLEHARRLYDAAASPKRLHVVPGAGHNDVISVGGQRYLEVLRDFLASPLS